jgi:hypothetical protein
MSFFDQVCEGAVHTLQAAANQELTAMASISRAPGKSKKVDKMVLRQARPGSVVTSAARCPTAIR